MKKNLKKILTVMLAVILLMSTGFAAVSAAPGKNNGKGKVTQATPEKKAPEKKEQEKKAIAEEAIPSAPKADESQLEAETQVEETQEEIPASESASPVTAAPEAEEPEISEAMEPTVTEASEEEIADEDDAEETAETSMPAQSFNVEAEDIEADIDTDVTVIVEADQGIFPADTSMSVKKVDPSEISDAICEVIEAPILDLVAVDITFENEIGEEIQPTNGVKVSLIPADALDAASYSLVHIKKDDETGKPIAELINEEKIFEIGAEGAVFEAISFSEYVLVAEGEGDTAGEETAEGEAFSEVFAKAIAAPLRAAASDAPVNSKKLHDNGDGTHTLSLSVTGAQSSSSTTEVSKANVILVVDTSNSMNSSSGTTTEYVYTEYTTAVNGQGTTTGQNNVQYWRLEDGDYTRVYYTNRRWRTGNSNNSPLFTGTVYTRSGGEAISRIEAEKEALTKEGGIIDNLLAQNVAGDPVKSDIIEVAIANFGTRGSTAQTFTTNATTLKNTINDLSTSSGTNWEEGLMRAQEFATSIKTSQPNEAVYVIFLTDGEPTTHNNDYTVNTNYAQEWGFASDNARAIVTAGHTFYGLFTWGSGNSSHYLSSLVNYAYTGSGNYNSSLAPAYAQYFTDASDTETLIEALNQIVHDITTGVGYTNVEIEDGVTSMTTSSVKATAGGDVTGVTYYRSGGSYGPADPDNGNYGTQWTDAPHATINDDGEVDWDLGSLILEDGVTYTITFVVWPSQESLDLVADLNNGIISYDSLSDDQKSQIAVSGNHYTLKTNTDYPTVTYSTVTTTTVDGETTTVVSDPITANITNPEPVSIAEDKLHAIKAWEDTLDFEQREEIGEVTLYLLVDNQYYYVDEGGEPLGVHLTEESDWTETEYVSIAPGLLVTEESPAYDPDATHVDYGGHTYAIIESGHEYVFEEKDINYHYELTAYTHHPMIMGENTDGSPRIVDVVFTKDDSGNITGIESVENMGDALSATNTLKGGINIEKKVVDASGKELDSGDPFTVRVNLTDKDGDALPTKITENGTEFTIDYRIYYGEKNPAYSESGDQHRSEHIYKTGTWFEETLYVGDVIRVVNVENEALFNVEEELPAGYDSKSFDYKIAYGTETAAAYDSSDIVVKDQVSWYPVKGNSASSVTVTNKLPEVFYVYHSSDNTVERIALNDSRISGGKFSIVNETKSGTLYGGYYKVYGNTTATDNDVKGLAYTEKTESTAFEYVSARTGGVWAVDDKGNAYEGDQTSWTRSEAYTEAGTAVSPTAGTVYYLKEVPDVYLQPATYVVYDTYDVDEDGFYQIKKLHLMTATDDGNYINTGFDVTTSAGIGKTGTYNAEFWGSEVTVTKDGAAYDTVNATRLITGHTGLIADKEVDDYIVANANYREIPYHITPDNIKVTSLKQMAVFLKNTRFKDWTKPGMYKSTLAKNPAYLAIA